MGVLTIILLDSQTERQVKPLIIGIECLFFFFFFFFALKRFVSVTCTTMKQDFRKGLGPSQSRIACRGVLSSWYCSKGLYSFFSLVFGGWGNTCVLWRRKYLNIFL